MKRSTRRLLLFVLALPPVVLFFTLVYYWGMAVLEEDPRSFMRSLMTVVETITTTGYGADSEWTHPFMNGLVIFLQIVGVLVVFLIFPVYLIPFMEERFEARLPTEAPPLHDHIVIYGYGPPVASLVHELETSGIPSVIIEEDEPEARRLLEMGHTVVHRVLEDDSLRAARLTRAQALIANGTDDQNADIVLAARQMGFSGEILAFVEEASHRKALSLAGATAVYDPRHILGACLAARASERIHPTIAGAQVLGGKLEVWELRVQPESELAGKTLVEIRLGPGGATVIGLWVGGTLVSAPTAGTRIPANSILVAAGTRESMERLREMAGPARPLVREGTFLVAGFGEVGHKVVELLRDAGEDVQVIDRIRNEGVDIVGDVLDPDILEHVDLDKVQTAILALDTDSATLFATVILRDRAPELPIVARVNRDQNITKIHRAGADYALSMSAIAGQMLARRLLGQESLAVDPQLKVMKVSAQGVSGQRLGDVHIRRRTGASVVAVERDDRLIVDFSDPFRFEASDVVYICGDSEALRSYKETYLQDAR